MDYKILFESCDEDSEDYKKQLILKYFIIWSSLILLSLIIFFITKNFWALFIWIAFYAIYRRQCLFDKRLDKNFNIIHSNKTIRIINYLFKIIFSIIIIRYIILNYII